MGIIIAIIAVLAILGIGRAVFRFRAMYALIKKARNTSGARVQTEPNAQDIPDTLDMPETPDMPDIPDISDDELKKKLTTLNTLQWVGRLTIPVFVVLGFTYVALHVGREMHFGEFAVRILLPVAAALILVIVTLYRTSMRISELKSLMGAAVTLPVVKGIMDVRVYRPHGHMERGLVSSAGLIGGWEAISGSDYIAGIYRGVNIRYSDLTLTHEEEEKDSDGNKTKHTVTDFKGQWLVCDFGRELAASVRLIERKGGTRFQRIHDISKSDIETENVAFNKKYRIITADGYTAFYLLTPHFMERLIAADERADASTLFCFGDGKLHIALYSGRDSFELKGVNPGGVDSVRQKFRGELAYLTGIIDELLLNGELFKTA